MTNNTIPRRESTEKKVIGFLKKNADGLTITELTSQLNFSQSTTDIALTQFRGSYKSARITKVCIVGDIK